MANVAALMIPYQYLDKVFPSHLHTDHMGDIDFLWAGGWDGGAARGTARVGPFRRHAGDGHRLRHGTLP